jgi:signal transduction histidine kinase
MTARPALFSGADDVRDDGFDGRVGAGLWSFLGNLPWIVFPLVIGIVQVGGTYGASHHPGAAAYPGGRPLDAVAWVLAIIGPASIAVFRRAPAAALAVCTACAAIYLAREYAAAPVYLSYVFTLVWAIMRGYHVFAWCSVAVLFVGQYLVPVLVAGARWPSLSTFGADVAWAVACLGLAEGVNFRRQRAQATMRARREQARRRSSDERLAIARELHDVLAHSISLINVQAGTTLEVMDKRPEQARIALEAIKLTSKQALDEVRSVLNALRGPDAPVPAPLGPTAGLDRLDALVSRARATGLDVRVDIVGAADRRLPAGVDLAAYRIIQEALTNVVRHAHATTATVEIEYEPDAVRITVADDGRGHAAWPVNGSGGGGNGLPGMHERAVALGGELTAGPGLKGGFEVQAWLPRGTGAPPPSHNTDSGDRSPRTERH